jgi:hypothetical protein
MSTYHKTITTIFSQVDDGSTPLTVFATVDEAKSYFWTTEALAVVDSHTGQVAYQLVADANGDNTKLKKTEGFDAGAGVDYNSNKTSLINSNGWGNNPYTTESSEDHLF